MKGLIKLIVVASLWLGVMSSALAQALQVDARVLLDQFAYGLQSLSGEFTQVTVDGRNVVVEESAGTLLFQAPDRIRWDYLEPFPQVLLADGQELWHYDELLEQVTVRPQPAADESPLLVLTRPELLERFYRIVPTELATVIEFEPLAEASEFERARLIFEGEWPVALDLFDRFGQSTRLELINLVRNPNLDPARFQFAIPEGADVLEGL
ncbi:MAG: outer membrane lipoprotein chaperone LolA [Pseudomonadota bacterium]